LIKLRAWDPKEPDEDWRDHAPDPNEGLLETIHEQIGNWTDDELVDYVMEFYKKGLVTDADWSLFTEQTGIIPSGKAEMVQEMGSNEYVREWIEYLVLEIISESDVLKKEWSKHIEELFAE
jgi:hypothetical protein